MARRTGSASGWAASSRRMKNDGSLPARAIGIGDILLAPGDRRVTFPIDNGIYGVNSLATHLNALVEQDGISAWHLAGWTDWKHRAVRIDFASPEDARRAVAMCRAGEPGARSPGSASDPRSEPARSGRRTGDPDGRSVWDDEGGAQSVGRAW